MRFLISGASGFIGRHLVSNLLAAGHEIVACVRRPMSIPKQPGLEAVPADFRTHTRPEAWVPLLDGIDAVVNCVGIIAESRPGDFEVLHHRAPVALFDACERRGIKRVVQISALGADDTAFSRYHLSKRAADEHLAGMDLDWIILQPSLVYGSGGQSTKLLSAMAALPLVPLIGDGGQRLQPVHIDDLAEAVSLCLGPNPPTRCRLPVVGPNPLTLREFLVHLRRWLGHSPARFVPFPAAWVQKGADLAGRIFPTAMNGEAIRMLQAGNVGDPGALTAWLGHPPLSVESALLRHPVLSAERQQASLLPVLPVLRVSLALLWIWSGFVSAFVFPREASLTLLASFDISGVPALVTLYGTASLDVLLGAALLLRYRIRLTGSLQILLMLGYSIGIALFLPEFWLHPFAPIAKNIPLIAATLAVMAAEEV